MTSDRKPSDHRMWRRHSCLPLRDSSRRFDNGTNLAGMASPVHPFAVTGGTGFELSPRVEGCRSQAGPDKSAETNFGAAGTSGRATLNREPRSNGEQGSALLIVFVLAAAIAIMLYREIPVAITEGQRQKEQLLIDRGAQYQRGIQLYFRNRKTYPPSLDALESTNNLRFLRRRYVDPFTGKADWRILHMGPAGPIDSLVNPINPAAAGNAPTGFGAPSSNASSQSSSNSASPQTSAAPGAGAQGTDATGGMPGMTQGQFGLQPDTGLYPAKRAPAANAASMQRQAGMGNDQSDPNAPPPLPDGSQIQGSATGQGQPTDPTQAANQNQAPGAAGQNANGGTPNGDQQNGAPGNGTGAGGTPAGIASQILHSPGPTITPGQTQSQSNPFGGGSIGGVASTVKGHSIKIVNEQRDYAKWEFVYDYRKDTGGSAASSQQNPGQQGGVGTIGGIGSTPSAFGSTPSAFGNTSSAAAPAASTAPPSTGTQTPPNQ
jgi:hypothetical protein